MNLKEFEMSGTNSDTQNEVKRGAWSELEYNLLESNLQDSTSEHLSYSFPIMPPALENFERAFLDENSQVVDESDHPKEKRTSITVEV